MLNFPLLFDQIILTCFLVMAFANVSLIPFFMMITNNHNFLSQSLDMSSSIDVESVRKKVKN